MFDVTYNMGGMMYRCLRGQATISPRPPTSLVGFVCVVQTVVYLAVVSTHMAVGNFRSPVRRSGSGTNRFLIYDFL